MPDIPIEIELYIACFTLCETQLRMGFGGAYALDYSVVTRVADSMGLATDYKFYRLLKAFEAELLEQLNKESKDHGKQ